MKKYFSLLIALLFVMPLTAAQPADYTWESMSENSSASMPVGGGGVGLNVWVENGDLLFYVCHGGDYDENNTLLKAGRVRIKLPGEALAPFSQTLCLSDGYCRVSMGGSTVTLWADVYKPVVTVEIESKKALSPIVSYESWRHHDRDYRKGEGKQGSWKWNSNKSLKTTADSIFAAGQSVTFCHINPAVTVFDTTVKGEGLDSVKSQMWNPLANLVSGGRLYGSNLEYTGTSDGVYDLTDYRAWNFKAKKPARSHRINITLHHLQTPDLKQWEAGLDRLESSIQYKKDRAASRSWWRSFWERSYIEAPVTSDSEVRTMARNYTLFRFMLGCNAYGDEPTKFNGGLFTFDPSHVNDVSPFTPDYRNWGGGTMTAQNQRLVYWPMLKSGDTDMMPVQFEFYSRILATAELRSRVYWGHGGACFTEQLENFGLPNLMEYGNKRPAYFDPGVEYNAWLEYCWDTVLEFCQMILDTEVYVGADISRYCPLIESSLKFFDEHYQYLASRRGRNKLDGEGKLVLFPGSGCETYKMATNAASTVAGLRRVLSSYKNHLKLKGDTALSYWEGYEKRLPEIPLRTLDGRRMISPALLWERINNVESPQLYPVWPWKFYGVTKGNAEDLEIARNTYSYDPDALKFRTVTGWKQDNIWAACLGLTEEAFRLNADKWKDGKHRFPVFLGPGYDWTPDHNWGGSAMIGLQEMLLQTEGDKIFILPAWPLDKDISFKLHAPGSTTVEVTLRGGKLEKLNVSPVSRLGDVIVPDAIKP